MNPAEIGNAVTAGTMTTKQGVAELKKLGYSDGMAREQIFIALGGDDIIATNAQGQDVYLRSGKTLVEVANAMRNR